MAYRPSICLSINARTCWPSCSKGPPRGTEKQSTLPLSDYDSLALAGANNVIDVSVSKLLCQLLRKRRASSGQDSGKGTHCWIRITVRGLENERRPQRSFPRFSCCLYPGRGRVMPDPHTRSWRGDKSKREHLFVWQAVLYCDSFPFFC